MVLLTGYSGFLGQVLYSSFKHLNVVTIGRDVNSSLVCDLSFEIPKIENDFELVIHAAGKAHSIPRTEEENREFYDVNVLGTQNLLKGIEQSGFMPRAFLFISSVSVYGLEFGENINEESPLNAHDPYGLSKINAEKLVSNWCIKNNIICTILRLPLLAGPNPPGNLGNMITAIEKGYYFNIGGGKARKSIVLAEDVAQVIHQAVEIGGIYNLTDGYHPSFEEISVAISTQLGKDKPLNIPYWFGKFLAYLGDVLGNKFPLNSNKLNKITLNLTYDDSKARALLSWNPRPILKGFKIK